MSFMKTEKKDEKISLNTPTPEEKILDKIYDGYLEKKGGKVTIKWQRRYFCIRGMKFIYGKDEKELLDSIDRSEILQIENVPLAISGHFVFKLKTPKRVYEFRSKSKSERDTWVDILDRWKKGEFDQQLRRLLSGEPEKKTQILIDQGPTIDTFLEQEKKLESTRNQRESFIITKKENLRQQPSEIRQSLRSDEKYKELFSAVKEVEAIDEGIDEPFYEIPPMKPFYWENIGEKGEVIDIESKILANKQEIEQVIKRRTKTSSKKSSNDVLHFEPADRINVETNILSYIYGESKIYTADTVYDKRVYWSGRVILQTVDEKNKTKDIEISLVLTWGHVIFFNNLLEEIGRISIPRIQYILQDRFDFKKVAILTYINQDEEKKNRDYLIFFDTSERKIDFFHYFSSTFYTFDGKTPNIWFVEGIEVFVRHGDSSVRPKVVKINAEDVLYIHDDKDYINVKNEKDLFEEILKSGDTEILFSDSVEKHGDNISGSKPRKWCLTDQAMYIFAGKNPRRIELEEISQIFYKDNSDKVTDIVFRIPAEYDLHIRISTEKAKEILRIFQDELFDGLECEKVMKDIASKAQISKSPEYKDELKKLKNVNYIKSGLSVALKLKNKRELNKYLRYSNKLNNNEKKELTILLNEAEKVIRELKESGLVKEQFKEAIISRDLSKLFELSNTYTFEVSELKSFYRIVNEEIMSMKIEDMINSFDFRAVSEKQIRQLMTLARKWGLMQIVDDLKVKVNKKIQQRYAIESLRASLEKNDLNEIRILLMNAQNLEIPETEPKIIEAKKKLPVLLLEAQIRRDIKESTSLDHLIEIETTPQFKSLSFDQQQKLLMDSQEQKKKLELEERNARWFQILETEIKVLQKKIRSRDDSITGLNALDELNKILKDVPSKDVQIPEYVTQTIELVKKSVKSFYKKKCDAIRPDLEKAILTKNEEAIEELLVKYKEFEHESMRDLANQGQKILDTFKKERELVLLMSIALKIINDPYKSNSLVHIAKICQAAVDFPKLEKLNQKLQVELERLYRCQRAEEVLDEALLSLDSTLIKSAIDGAREFPNLKEKINNAYRVMGSNDEKVLLISNKLDEALQDGDRQKIMKVIGTAKLFSALKEKVQQAIEILKSDRYKSERETDLYLLLEEKNNQGDSLDEFISLNSEFLTENEINIAKKALFDIRKRDYSIVDIKHTLTKAIASKDTKLLAESILEAENIYTQNKEFLSLLQNAKDILQKLNIGFVSKLKDDLSTIETDSDSDAEHEMELLKKIQKETKTITIQRTVTKRHPLIEELHKAIQDIMIELKDAKVIDQRWEIEMENVKAQKVVKILSDMLSDKPQRSFLFGEKKLWNIFENFKESQIIQKYIEFFNNLDIVKKLPEVGKEETLSLMFIHYTLHKGVLLEMIQQIISNNNYLIECYQPDSIIRNPKYRDDLYSTLSLLFQFHFRFDITQSQDVLIAHPLSRMKMVCRNVVSAFMIKDESEVEQARKTIIGLIKREVHQELWNILNYGFYNRTLFGKYHIWDVIEDATNQKKISAMDFGGILLPPTVDRINNLTQDKDIKFKLFIFSSLNDKALGDFLLSIFTKSTCEKYYAKNAIVFDEEIFLKIVDILSVFTKLEFKFDLEKLLSEKQI